jgi:low affinity Fe/Cu permease
VTTQLMLVVAVAIVVITFVVLLRGVGSARHESRLVRQCQGDTAQAERLLQAELNRSPGLSRDEAALRALQRLERDNR